jgi:quercetin dioxygenase-like cupin family protein
MGTELDLRRDASGHKRMSAYTVTNLKDVDDSGADFGLAPDFEVRFARSNLGGERSGMSYQRFAPNLRLPFGHKHSEQEETYVVLSGTGRMKLDEDVVELRQWDAVRVAAGTARNFEAGPDGAELLAFGAGPAGDFEVFQNWWPREAV